MILIELKSRRWEHDQALTVVTTLIDLWLIDLWLGLLYFCVLSCYFRL